MPRPKTYCTVEGCRGPNVGRGLCRKHYTRLQRWGDVSHVTPAPIPVRLSVCEIEGCTRPQKAHGWCQTHYRRWQRHGDTAFLHHARGPNEKPLAARPKKRPKPCVIAGCERDARSRGWCKSHYNHWRRWGDPIAAGRVAKDPRQRWLSMVEFSRDGCWLWKGARDQVGYPMFGTDRTHRAHRWGYQNFVAPVADELEVDHLCHVKACVRFDHLEPVTPAENSRRATRYREERKRADK